MLCSDGLTDMVDKSTMTTILTQSSSLEDKAAQLIAVANNNGGHDNITVVLVQNNKVAQRPDATMPASVLKKKESLTEGNTVTKQYPSVNKPIETKPVNIPAKTSNWPVALLSLLCLAFLASTVWFYLKGLEQSKPVQSSSPIMKAPVKNADEIKLQNAIDKATGNTLLLSDTVFKQPVLITDTLKINKDTLYIKGNITIKRDSAYNGPAFTIAAKCKTTGIEGLKLEDFNTAIQSSNSFVTLKNVQFINCVNGIQKAYPFITNKLITVDLPVMHYRADTIAISTAKPNGTK